MRRLTVYAMALACLVAARSGAQQADTSVADLRRQNDSIARVLRAQWDSLQAVRDRMRREFTHPTEKYALALTLGVSLNAVFRIDDDPGGYTDRWGTPDKWMHFSVASFLTERALRVRVPPAKAALLTCAAAGAFELSQRYHSLRDASASCAGAFFAVGFHWLENKASGGRRF